MKKPLFLIFLPYLYFIRFFDFSFYNCYSVAFYFDILCFSKVPCGFAPFYHRTIQLPRHTMSDVSFFRFSKNKFERFDTMVHTSILKDRINFLTHASAAFGIRSKMVFLASGKHKNMFFDDFGNMNKIDFVDLLYGHVFLT